MTRFAAFQSQLTSIMEALSRAAVAEICELLDDSYAVFQLELRRSHAENQALRRKLELIQDVVARGHRSVGMAAEAVPAEGEPEFSRPLPPESAVRSDIFLPERSSSCGGGLHQPGKDRRRKGRVSAATAPPAGEGDASAAGAEELAEQDLMKEKSIKTEEDVCDASDTLLVRGDGPGLRFRDNDSERGASRMRRTSAVDAAPWDHSGLRQHSSSAPGSPTRALHFPSDVLFSQTSESGRDSPGQTRKLFLGGPGGSLSVEKRGASATASQPLDPDLDLGSAWTQQGLSSLPAVPHRLLDGSSDLSSRALGLGGSRSALLDQNQPCRDRRFVCSCCRKGFTSSRSLETHMRVHTGERPYGCPQCGKRFTQSGHLKTHQSVHTGERPFACQHCGKRFAGKQNLRIHQQKHHPAERGGA